MSRHRFEQELVALLPRARRYGRALLGDTGSADSLLLKSAANIVKLAPPISFTTPKKMILPWLFIEFHKLHDAHPINIPDRTQHDRFESALYEQIDSGLLTLSNVQKRVYLLTVLERFETPMTARVLRQSEEQVLENFHQAHRLVHDHVSEHFMQQEAA